ncbi:hypothetical protein [Aquimarina sp. MMG016]|uniref:hypothetical protein n=1 Tax=Aquimarina sp. MMG016 TaxID=2822690 RepID=UPI001B3A3009|nr:hypothetical protein [Aquimarina sp. MMG016]MBQ4822705.1 hypothetical protein [Aquimarina sp. MMG016]
MKYLFLILLSFLLFSCNTAIHKAQNWLEKANNATPEKLEGNYFQIENTRVKTFLPPEFKQYTTEQYRKTLDSVFPKNQVKAEMRRLETMRDVKGSFSLFFDNITGSTYTINTFPFTPFNRNDAKMLLAMMRKNNDKVSLTTDLNFKKITATFKKTDDFTMFRSIFQIDNIKNDHISYSSTYFITAKKQTFVINLTTPFQVNFDRYIEKMKF